MNSSVKSLRATRSFNAFICRWHFLWLFLLTLTLLPEQAAALTNEYTGGGFVVIPPQMTAQYLETHPEAMVAVNNFALENGERVTIVLERTLPDRLIVSGTNNMYDFADFINFEMSSRVVPCIDSSKDVYVVMHGSGLLGKEFQFAKYHQALIQGTAEDLGRILAAINEEFPGVLKPGSNVGVTSCRFEARLLRLTTTCDLQSVNTSAAIKLQRELMENSALKELNMKVLSLSSEGRVHYPTGIKPVGQMLNRGAACEQRFEVRLFEEIVDETGLPYVSASGKKKTTHLRPITVKEVSSEVVEAVEQGLTPKEAYKEIYIKDRAVITRKNLKSLESVGTELAEYVIKERRFAGYPPVHIAPPPGSGLAAKIFSKGMLFIDTVMSAWEIGKVTYHSVLFYNEHTGALDGIARAEVQEDKWRKELASQIDDIKRIQYREDAKWAITLLNYLLGEQAKKEELYAYWAKQGRPRNVFYESDYIVNINNNIIFSYWRWRGRESYAAVDPELQSTAWKINVNPLIPDGTYYEPEWKPQARPYLEELILIPGVREEILKNISDLDCDVAKRFLGGKTSDEISHADLIALVGFLASQAYQELVDAAVLTSKPKDHFINAVTRGWAMHRKRAIEEAEKNPEGTSSLQPAAWIGIAGPGKLDDEYFSFLP